MRDPDCCSERVFTALAGANTDGLLDRRDEDLSIANPPGAGDRQDRLDDITNDVVLDDDLDPDLGNEVHDISRAAIDLLLATGSTKAFDLVDGHALNADFAKAILHI